MKISFLLIILSLCLSLSAQTNYENYSWTTIPPEGNSDTIRSINGITGLMERRITEIYLNKDNVFEELFVLHKKIKVETEQAIDRENKIYIPIDDMIDIVKIEARFISPGGKITSLKKENIKELKNLENKGNFQTFAIEGAEIGGQIEYFYILKKRLTPYGGIYVQEDVPQGDVMVIFTYPSELEYILKSYNGFPAFKKSVSANNMVTMKSSAAYIPGLSSERYAFYKAGLMSFEYTLSYNKYNSSLRIYSWNKASANIYLNVLALEKKEISAAESWLKKMKLTDGAPAARIRAIENKVKSEISISDQIQQNLDVKEILNNKQTNPKGVVRLFAALYESAGIAFELVVTGDMTSHPFDPEFNCFNFMDNYLMYFPQIDSYIVPDDPEYRLGIIPVSAQGGYGLFMKPMSFDENAQNLSFEVRQIPVTSCYYNADTLVQSVSVDLSQTTLNILMKRSFYGDIAQNFQSFWSFVNTEKKEEILKSVFNMGTENISINSYKLTNDKPDDIGAKPLLWDLDITANALVEIAGNDIIVNIGQTIGTQSELYQENARKLPINVGVLHSYYRKITFVIPEGYTVKDVSDLNMNVEMLNDGKMSCIFTSSAEIKDKNVIITSTEYYADPKYPVSRYEEFRKVINAAADFNKRTILMTKN